MTVTRRRVAIAVAVVLFLAVSVVVARWLQADTVERTEVERLLRDRVGGDGELEIIRYDSSTAHALGPARGPTRVVWRVPPGLPTVQCVDVRRAGNLLTGPRVSLLGLSAPIEREASC